MPRAAANNKFIKHSHMGKEKGQGQGCPSDEYKKQEKMYILLNLNISSSCSNSLGVMMPYDMWHMTFDVIWTCVTWNMTHRGWFLDLTVWDKQCFEDISTKDEWLNQLTNYEGV